MNSFSNLELVKGHLLVESRNCIKSCILIGLRSEIQCIYNVAWNCELKTGLGEIVLHLRHLSQDKSKLLFSFFLFYSIMQGF